MRIEPRQSDPVPTAQRPWDTIEKANGLGAWTLLLAAILALWLAGCGASPENAPADAGRETRPAAQKVESASDGTSRAGIGDDLKPLVDGLAVVSEFGDTITILLTTFPLSEDQKAAIFRDSLDGPRVEIPGKRPYLELHLTLQDAKSPPTKENVFGYDLLFQNFGPRAAFSERQTGVAPTITGSLKDGGELQVVFEKHGRPRSEGDDPAIHHCSLNQTIPVRRAQPPVPTIALGESRAGVGDVLEKLVDHVACVSDDRKTVWIAMTPFEMTEQQKQYFATPQTEARYGRTPGPSVELSFELRDAAAPPTRDNIYSYTLTFNGFGKLDQFGRGDDDGFMSAMMTGKVPTVTGELAPGREIRVSFERRGRLMGTKPKKDPQPHQLLMNEKVKLRAPYRESDVQLAENKLTIGDKSWDLVDQMAIFSEDRVEVLATTFPITADRRAGYQKYLQGRVQRQGVRIPEFEGPVLLIELSDYDRESPFDSTNRPKTVRFHFQDFPGLEFFGAQMDGDTIKSLAGERTVGGDLQLDVQLQLAVKDVGLRLRRTIKLTAFVASAESPDPEPLGAGKTPAPTPRPAAADLSSLPLTSLIGTYQRQPVDNDWHVGTIEQAGEQLRWTNRAGVSWLLTADLKQGVLRTDKGSPYYASHPATGRTFRIQIESPSQQPLVVSGFDFLSERYTRIDKPSPDEDRPRR